MSLRIATGTDGSVKERKGLKRKFAAYAGLAFGLILIAGLFAGCGKRILQMQMSIYQFLRQRA